MKVVITGGGGFLGNQLARKLVERGSLTGPSGGQESIDQLVLFDKFIGDDRKAGLKGKAEFVEGDMSDRDTVFGLVDRDDIAVFHLASMVSGECEVEFDEAIAVNLDGGRYLLEALRARQGQPRIIFTSSVAAFGGAGMPDVVGDSTKRTPQTTYGVTKVITELLINDYTRKGFLDGRAARLPTVIIRPGKPNTAASSFCSGMFREPLAGQPCELPVARSQKMPVVGYRTVVSYFIELHELDQQLLDDDRTFTLPSLNLSVDEMATALELVAARRGIELGALIDKPDPVIQRIVDSWPVASDAGRALALGLPDVEPLEAIIEGYLDDFHA
ncbi:MAG: nucleoside-diphosphate-sugar epimerase [Verrucomicrobiales bacterium]|jgi:nucleoside-diphosphate-sugar epimerase